MPARPSLLALLRTLRCVCIDLPRCFLPAAAPWHPIASSATPHGLADIRRQFARIYARLGLRLTIAHAWRLPLVGGFVVMWNQTSHLDHLVFPLVMPRPFFSLYNNEVARLPLYGRVMRDSGHVHVDRHDPAQWRPAITRAAARVAAGECVVVSPEGTRSRDGALLPFKRGAFQLALAARRPIVPVRIVGAHDALPRGRFVVRPGEIHVEFSPPIATADSDADDPAPLMARVAAALRPP